MIGAEYSHTERQDDYVNPEGYVPTSFSELKEQNILSLIHICRFYPQQISYSRIGYSQLDEAAYLQIQ